VLRDIGVLHTFSSDEPRVSNDLAR
jgi:hypothetical protein